MAEKTDTLYWNNSGTRQSERFPKALEKDYISIDERSYEDLIRQVAEYASRLHYYNDHNQKDGNWKRFFTEIYDYEKQAVNKDHLEQLIKNADVPPHLALMLAFLKVFQIQQNNLNKLTERHLDFYYKDILGFHPRKGTTGKVPVFFELNKNAESAFIAKGCLFDAGKDEEGKPIRYAAADEIRINRAKVSATESIRITDKSYAQYAPNIAFALASPVLNLKDGDLTLSVKKNSTGAVDLSAFTIYYTAKNGWLELTDPNHLPTDQIVPYNASVHGEGYSTADPVMKFVPCTDSTAKELMEYTISTLSGMEIKVEKSKDFILENDEGRVLNQEGTLPFGSHVRMGDSFRIRLPFIPSTDAKFNIRWKNDVENNIDKPTKENSSSIFRVKLKDDTFSTEKYLSDIMASISKNNVPSRPFAALSEPITVSYTIEAQGELLKMFTETSLGIQEVPATRTVSEQATPSAGETADASGKTEGPDEAKLFPIYENIIGNDSLYLKIENAIPDDVLSLYFLIHPNAFFNTGNEECLKWHYWTGKEWKAFLHSDIIKDTTHSLQHSGLLYLQLNRSMFDASADKSIRLRAQIQNTENGALNFSALEEIQTQVVELDYSPLSEGKAPIGTALPAGTITKSINAIAGIKKIKQSYEGEKGTEDESESLFRCRVSEKLRHKGRAWSAWDYERLLLEKFPDIAAVKCLHCYKEEEDGTASLESGRVTLLVLPHTQLSAGNNYMPMVNNAVLSQAKEYLKNNCCSPFVEVNVVSPIYEEVTVSCEVTLRCGYTDTIFYQTLLNEELIRYFAPWTDGNSHLDFSRDINQSDVMEFIDGLFFVEYVERLNIKVCDREIPTGGTLQPAIPTHLITSAPLHQITISSACNDENEQ